MVDKKKCHKCHEHYPLSSFNSHKGTKDGLDNRCKACIKKIKEKTQKIRSEIKESKPLDLNKPNLESVDWQGGKQPRNIFQRPKDVDNPTCYIAAIQGNQKSFPVKFYGGKDKALKAAEAYVKQSNEKLGLITNKYKIIKEDGVPKYIILQIGEGYVTLTDFEHMDMILKHRFYVTRTSAKSNPNAKTYCKIQGDFGQSSFHKKITGYEITDHVNGYPMDNRKKNLRSATISDNNKNRTKVRKTEISEEGGKIMVKIVHAASFRDFKENILKKNFETYKDATNWIEEMRNEIDKDIKIKERKQLRREFEAIMKKHCDGFKWNDEIKIVENDAKIEEMNQQSTPLLNTIHSSQPVSERKDHLSSGKFMTDKEKIYHSFVKINPKFDYHNMDISGRAIRHITHDGNEYKYCSKCELWVKITEYPANIKNWDKLDRRCKGCKNASNKNSTKLWKQQNKEKIKEYNKKYREENSEKVKQLNKEWYEKNGEQVKEKRKKERAVTKPKK